jgi:hypothetical protein
MEAKKGQALFYHEVTPIAKIIQNVTKGIYSHCELCIADNISLEVRPSHIGLIDLTHKKLKAGEYIDIKMPIWKDMEMGIKKALDVLAIAKGYSLGNVMAFFKPEMKYLRRIHNKDFEDDFWIICSEVVGDCLEIGGVKKNTDIENSLLSPNDIIKYFEWE